MFLLFLFLLARTSRKQRQNAKKSVKDTNSDEEEELLSSLSNQKEERQEKEPDDKIAALAKEMLQNGNLARPTISFLKQMVDPKDRDEVIRKSKVSEFTEMSTSFPFLEFDSHI